MREERLSEIVATLESGSRPKGGVQEGAEGVLSLGAEHLDREGGFDFSKVKRIPNDYFKQMKKGRIARDDILVVKDGATTGKTSFISATFPDEPAAVNEHVFIVRVDPLKAFPSYVFRYLQSPNGQLQVLSDFRGATVGGVSRGFVDRVKIPLPPLPEQRRIAAILDKADAIRRKRQQMLDLADQFLRSAFLDLFGDPVTNPKSWPIRKLGDFADIRSGVTKGRKLGNAETISVPYMRVANVQDGKLDLSNIKEIEIRTDELEQYRLCTGDLLLTEGGDPDKLGRGSVWTGEIEPCVHQNHIFSVRVDRQVSDPHYLSALIGSEYGKRHFLRIGKQTTGIATINKTQLRGFPALLPPIQRQRQYSVVVRQFEESLGRLSRMLDTHEDLLSSLTQRAFRGDV